MSVGYTKEEEKEIQSLTSTEVAVITAGEGTKMTQPALLDLKHSPSPLANADKSDDEDSDHGDPYGQHMKGRVSPSPYTANTERARQFNTYVRNLIEEKLDILIPISHQPRELVQQIITDSNLKFPEFSSSVRKRIRTYLKSYRRSRRVKDMQAAAALASNYHSNGLTTHKDRQINDEGVNISSIALPTAIQANSSAIITITGLNRANLEEDGPEAKKRRLAITTSNGGNPAVSSGPSPTPVLTSSSLQQQSPSQPAVLTLPAVVKPQPLGATPSGQQVEAEFNNTEVATLKRLIQGYRESAKFLNKAADQLEELVKENSID